MKLPSIQQGAVQPIAKQDVMAPLAEANARMAVFNSVGVAINDAVKRYTDRENKRQTQEFDLAMQQRAIDFEKTYGGKLEFDPMDPETMNDPEFMGAMQKAGITDINAKIPAYRILPELRANFMKKSAEELSTIISDDDIRNEAMGEVESFRLKQYLKDTADANQQQIIYADIQTTQAVSAALRERDYGAAKLAVTTSQWTTDRQEDEINKITRQEQIDGFNEVLKLENPNQMMEALSALEDPEDKRSSHLSEAEERSFANALRSNIKQLANKAEGSLKAEASIWKDKASKLTTQLQNGEKYDPIEAAEITAVMQEIDPVKAINLQLSERANTIVAQLSQRPLDEQLNAKAQLAGATETYDAYVAGIITKNIDKNAQAIKSDTIGFMKNKQVMDVAPIDFGSPEGLAISLQKRVGVYDQAQNMYNYSSGYLDDTEALMFNDMIERSKDPVAKLAIFESIQAGLGDKAGMFYEQLKNKNLSGSDMIAGQLATDGFRNEAITIMKGNQLRKDNKDLVTKDAKDVIDDLVAGSWGNAFSGNPMQRDLLKEAAYNAYATYANTDSDFGSADRKRAQLAIDTVTGGIIDYNGSQIQAPTPKMSGGDFEKWIDTRSPMLFAGSNALQSTDEIKQLVSEGTWKLRGVGRGVYNIIDNKGGTLKTADGAMNFELKYDPAFPIDYTPPTTEELKEIERRKKVEKGLFSGAGLNQLPGLLKSIGIEGLDVMEGM